VPGYIVCMMRHFSPPLSAWLPRFVAWEHFACTPARYQDLFAGEDPDPFSC